MRLYEGETSFRFDIVIARDRCDAGDHDTDLFVLNYFNVYRTCNKLCHIAVPHVVCLFCEQPQRVISVILSRPGSAEKRASGYTNNAVT